jgi:nicotinate-nucleotide pyrophosphorylase (carboxylating)
MALNKNLQDLITGSLQEDLGDGDITTRSTIEVDHMGKARIISKQSGILAGITICQHVFFSIDNDLEIKLDFSDGDRLQSNETVMVIAGRISSILAAERTALNYLAHLSGIATVTTQFVHEIKDTKAKITDTRKTLPLLRIMEKDAVKAGGGVNHRMGLYDMVLIKENHILAAGGITRATEQTHCFIRETQLETNIEVEVRTLEDVREALTCDIDRIMLDNMTLAEMKEAVELINKQVEVEASGNVTLENVCQIALCGVDYISVGAITHSAPAFDFSLILDEVK